MSVRKILWLIGGDEGFGVRRATLGMAEALRRLDWEVGFATLSEGEFANEIKANRFQIWELSDGPVVKHSSKALLRLVFLHIRQQWRLRRRLLAVIKDYQPAWLHVRHNHLLPLAGIAAKAAGLRAYWHLPNTINCRLPFNLQAQSYQLFCRITGVQPLANSLHTAASLGDRWLTPRVLHLGVDGHYFSPNADFQPIRLCEAGLIPDVPIFVIIARIIPAKAQDRVIQAVVDLVEQGLQLQLVIVGGPVGSEFYQQLQRLVLEKGAEGTVKFIAPVKDPRPWFALADVVINSRMGAEPFGLTIVEAMLMGKPVLSCRAGGPSETIEEGTTGWLIDGSSVEDYRSGILTALAHRKRWTEMGRAGRIRAVKRYTNDAMAEKYLELTKAC